MVEAEAAGILFTADPVSGRRDRTVISAAWGLVDAVVGGWVTPDPGHGPDGSGEPLRDRPRTEVRVAGAEARYAPAAAPEGGEVPRDRLAALDAGALGGTNRRRHRGRRRKLGTRHSAGSRAARPGGFWRDEAGRGAGGQDHHTGLDSALGRRLGGRHRCRRTFEPRLHRRPRVRHPRCARNRRGYQAHQERPDYPSRWLRRYGYASERNARGGRLPTAVGSRI